MRYGFEPVPYGYGDFGYSQVGTNACASRSGANFTKGVTEVLPGIYTKGSVNLTASMKAFLSALRARLPSKYPLVVTDALRTPEDQAQRMLSILNREGEDYLKKLYRRSAKYIDALLAMPHTASAWGPAIAEFNAQGAYLSRHMRGDALDLRCWGWADADRIKVAEAAEKLGARVTLESDHIHVGRLDQDFTAQAKSATEALIDAPAEVSAAVVSVVSPQMGTKIKTAWAQLDRNTKIAVGATGGVLAALAVTAVVAKRRR